MFEFFYSPKKFCRKYIDARESSIQLVQFMATALGLKKAYDDWFPLKKIEKVKELCEEYGLYYKFDWIFVPKQDVSRVISGAGRLPTTKMLGFPFSGKFKDVAGATVHIFFSRSKRDLELCFRNGWYPLIIKNRAVHKPYIDHARFGYFLGYPDCCLNFFRKYNNHFRYSYLFEALKNTRSEPSIYCNPLLKNHTFSYIYHMPCAYDCAQTQRYVVRLREKLSRFEPELVRLTDQMLARPFLVLGEQNSYIFEGEIQEQEIIYNKFVFLGTAASNAAGLDSALARGDRVKTNRNMISVYREKEHLFSARQRFQPFVIKFREKK